MLKSRDVLTYGQTLVSTLFTDVGISANRITFININGWCFRLCYISPTLAKNSRWCLLIGGVWVGSHQRLSVTGFVVFKILDFPNKTKVQTSSSYLLDNSIKKDRTVHQQHKCWTLKKSSSVIRIGHVDQNGHTPNCKI